MHGPVIISIAIHKARQVQNIKHSMHSMHKADELVFTPQDSGGFRKCPRRKHAAAAVAVAKGRNEAFKICAHDQGTLKLCTYGVC